MKRLLPFVLLTLLGGPVLAQEPPARAGAGVQEQTRQLADEIAIARAVSTAQLSGEQLRELLGVLEEGFQQLEQGDRAANEQIAAHAEALAQARRDLLAGRDVDPEAEQAYVATIRRLAAARQQFRRQLQERAQRTLQQQLGPEQRDAFIAAARPAVVARRLEETPAHPAPFWATTEGQDQRLVAETLLGDLGQASVQELERLRASQPDDWERARLQFALSSAAIPGWWLVPGILGTGAQRPPVPPGVQRGGAEPPDLDDPNVQARLRPFLQFADRVRSIPPPQWAPQRNRSAQQLDELKTQTRREQETQRPIELDEALRAFTEVYLMHPRAVAVLRERGGG